MPEVNEPIEPADPSEVDGEITFEEMVKIDPKLAQNLAFEAGQVEAYRDLLHDIYPNPSEHLCDIGGWEIYGGPSRDDDIVLFSDEDRALAWRGAFKYGCWRKQAEADLATVRTAMEIYKDGRVPREYFAKEAELVSQLDEIPNELFPARL